MLRIFQITNLIFFILSSYAWVIFLLPVNPVYALLSITVIFTGHCLLQSKSLLAKRTIILAFLLSIITIWSLVCIGVSYSLLQFICFAPAITLFNTPKPLQEATLKFVTKWFAVFISISLGIFILTRFTSLPPLGVFKVPNDNFYPKYNNYLLFIESTSIFNLFFYRFNGPFLEPGHLSIICSLLIFANKYDFKHNKYLWILLVCIILSLSLAGYIICVIGYLFLKVKNKKAIFLMTTLISITFICVTMVWNEGKNPVNELIFSRLEYDEEKGVTGNNRTPGVTDRFFKKNWENGNLWTGLGLSENSAIAGAGYKVFFLRYGIISALLIFLFYMNLIPKNCSRRFAISFIALIILLFMQRAYPGWYSWLFTFTIGCGCSRDNLPKHKH